jgi:hypothetical protein
MQLVQFHALVMEKDMQLEALKADAVLSISILIIWNKLTPEISVSSVIELRKIIKETYTPLTK